MQRDNPSLKPIDIKDFTTRVVQGLLAADEVLITGETGKEKTRKTLAYVMNGLDSRRTLWLSPKYASLGQLTDYIRAEHQEEAEGRLIVEVRGREISRCKVGCAHKFEPDDWPQLKGPVSGIFTVESVPEGICPYESLRYLAKQAWLCLAHPRYFEKNTSMFNEYDTIVVDECDDLLMSDEYLLLRFRGFDRERNIKSMHLERQVDGIEPLVEAFKLLLDQPTEFPNSANSQERELALTDAYGWLSNAKDDLANIPKLEDESIRKAKSAGYDESLMSTNEFGSRTAYQRLADRVSFLNNSPILDDVMARFRALSYGYFASLPAELRQKVLHFWEVARNANRFVVTEAGPSDTYPNGRIDVHLVGKRGTDLNFFDDGKRKRDLIYISATPPVDFPPEVPVINLGFGELDSLNTFILFDNEKRIRELLRDLRPYNVMAVARSVKAAETLAKRYGGKPIEDYGGLRELFRSLDSAKGHLVYNHLSSRYAKAVNGLERFDLVIVFDWLTDVTADLKERGLQKEQCLATLYQMLGRVLRKDPLNVRRRKAVVLTKKNFEAFYRLKARYSGSRFVTVSEVGGAISLIGASVEPFLAPARGDILMRAKVSKRVGKKTEQFYLGNIPVPARYNEVFKEKSLEGKTIQFIIDPDRLKATNT